MNAWPSERTSSYAMEASALMRKPPGPEILQQTGRVDAFCAFVGSGGTFRGCAEAFRAANPDVRCYVVEPAGAAVLAGQLPVRPIHRLQGGGYSMRELKFLRSFAIDGYLQVTDDEAMVCARRLAREEGVFAGFSTGANLAAALQLLKGVTCRLSSDLNIFGDGSVEVGC